MLIPIFKESNVSFKKIKLEILFKGNSRDEILNNISLFTSKLINVIDLKLDGYKNKYRCILSEQETIKTGTEKLYKKFITLIGYEFGEEIEESIIKEKNKTILVKGNQETPAVVEIIPVVDIIDITLEGLADDPIKINNLKQNKKVILDGELQIITVDGVNKFGDTDMWDFPSLKPGSNTIKISRSDCNIKIKYKPRFI